MPDRCQTCKAPILWALTPAGKPSPLDRLSVPNEKGNVLLLQPAGMGGQQLLAVVLTGPALELARKQEPGFLYVSHWATCADREEWREKTREQQDDA